ncbi:MAG TPA: hypothetical protein VH477_01380 [Bryobacteraceae bacterium]|jgi:hypothetical protein
MSPRFISVAKIIGDEPAFYQRGEDFIGDEPAFYQRGEDFIGKIHA